MEKIKQLLIPGGSGAVNLPEIITRAFNDLFSRQSLTSAGLAVTGAAAVTAKISNTAYAVINGVLQSKTTTNLPVLTGYNLAAGQVGLVVSCIDGSGTLVNLYATPAATVGALQFPIVPATLAVLGFILINTGATFTGNTTAMDSVGISYFNQVGPFYPNSAF